MAHPLVEAMAAKFIHEVRDQTLSGVSRHFLGNWPVVQRNDVYRGLVEHLDDAQKDLLWKLLTEAVEQTMGATLAFMDHKHVVGEMRVTLLEPGTGAAHAPLDVNGVDYLDLGNEFWFNWMEKHPRVKDWPRTERRPVCVEDLPQDLRTAVAEDFPGAQILSQEVEVRTLDGRVELYHLLLSGQDAPLAFRFTGGRARVT